MMITTVVDLDVRGPTSLSIVGLMNECHLEKTNMPICGALQRMASRNQVESPWNPTWNFCLHVALLDVLQISAKEERGIQHHWPFQ